MRKSMAIFVTMLALSSLTSGCIFDEEDAPPLPPPSGPFDFNGTAIPMTTFYHYAGGVDATIGDNHSNLTGLNIPLLAQGTYYSIGATTFEPTIGHTSTGALFMTNYHGTGEGTHIIRSQDHGQTWVDVGPFGVVGGQVPNSNDPFIYVDPWTDRVYKFDMHALLGMTLEWSDDEGETWTPPVFVTDYTPQDHQSLASAPGPAIGYDNVLTYSINTGLQGGYVGGAYVSSSHDGGITWTEQRPGYPVDTGQCSGLSGHLVGSNNGNFYRGNPSCEGPAVYKSTDGGYTWSEHTLSTTIGTYTHEVAAGTDEADNVHVFWIGDDGLPYYTFSTDEAETWTEPVMVGPPGLHSAGFPTVAGGADGRVAFSYIGQWEEDGVWHGFIGSISDSHSESPLITTVAVNAPNDPLDETFDCGFVRCGGFGDFIDITIDPDGRPWAALAHNPSGETGIVGTFMIGPALRGNLSYLDPLPEGGESTL